MKETTSMRRTKKPAPDLKGATAEILRRTADWMERGTAGSDAVLIPRLQGVDRETWAVLTEARKLAINYVRMGAGNQPPEPPANVPFKKGA